jgi:hypothetical protein
MNLAPIESSAGYNLLVNQSEPYTDGNLKHCPHDSDNGFRSARTNLKVISTSEGRLSLLRAPSRSSLNCIAREKVWLLSIALFIDVALLNPTKFAFSHTFLTIFCVNGLTGEYATGLLLPKKSNYFIFNQDREYVQCVIVAIA